MNDFQGIGVAVIGCGHWGKNLVRNFNELGVLKAVWDPDPAIQQTMKSNYQIQVRNIEEIMSDNSITAVVIAVPAELHAELALKAFDADKHVFIEKPITLTIEEAQSVCDRAVEQNKTLMVGHLLQYHPAFLKLKEMVKNGDVGKIRYLYSRRLSFGKVRAQENVLWSLAPHDISMVLALLDEEPDNVACFDSNFLQKGISDFTSIHMSFPSGARAHIETSWLNPFKEQRLVVVGENAMLEFDDRVDWPQKLKIYKHQVTLDNGVPELKPAEAENITFEPGEPLRNECVHFLKFIKTGETPFTDGREAMAVLRVLKAADDSSNRWEGQ